MDEMKIKLPEGGTSVSLDGVTYEADENGIALLPLGLDIAPLLDHGCTIPGPEAKKAEGTQEDDAAREALFNRAVDMGLKPHYKAGIPKLTEMIAEAEAKKAEEPKAEGEDAPAAE